MFSWLVAVLFKSLLLFLSILFVNRYLKFDHNLVNLIEEAVGKGIDWLRAHNLSIRANINAIAGFVVLALFVNWYAELDNEFLNSLGDDLLSLVQSDAWNNVIPALDSATKLLMYTIVIVAFNRFFKLQIDIVERIDRRLIDFLDRLILSHGGLFELVSKTTMTLIVAMLVNHHAGIGFPPLVFMERKTIAALGLEGMGESSAARRARKRCEREMETFEVRAALMNSMIATAEAEGRVEAAISFRNKLDDLLEEYEAGCR